MLVLLRELMRGALHMHVAELSSIAQIELPKRGWKKATKTESVLAQQSHVMPARDDAGSPHALTQQSEVVVTPDEAGSASTLRLRHLLAPPENMSLRDVVRKIFPQLKKALLDAHYYVVGEQKNKNHPSTQDISEKFPLLADAEESQIERYVIRREGSSVHQAALHMIHEICGLPVETVNRYRHPMRKDKSSREQHGDGNEAKI